MNSLTRKYLFPITVIFILLVFLVLWVLAEFYNIYSKKRHERLKTAAMAAKLVSGVFERELDQSGVGEAELKSLARRMVNKSDIAHLRIEGKNGFLIEINKIPPRWLVPIGSPGGENIKGDYLIFWRTINFSGLGRTQKKYQLTAVIDAGDYFEGIQLETKLLLLVLIFGSAVIVVFVLTWSVISRNWQMQSELRGARSRREQIEELRLTAAGLAHETKNPLGIIRGLAQQIASDKLDSEKTTQMAREIMEQSDVTSSRLGDFLSYAKVRKPEFETVDAGQYVPRVANLLADDFAKSGVALEAKAQNIKILVDPDMMSQVILNLLMNSLKFTITGKVAIKLQRDSFKQASLTVIDTGSGIPADILPDIFKPYISNRADGYGIGLAIVKRIAEESGWQVTAKSDLGKGTEIRISGIKTVAS